MPSAKKTPWEFVLDPQAGWDDLFTLKHHREVARKWLGESLACEQAFGDDLVELHNYKIANATKDAEMLGAVVVLTQRIQEITNG